MATFLLELFSEEIPSRMQQNAAEQLSRLVTTSLQKAGLPFGDVKSFVSPRHLALQVAGLPLTQPDTKEERRGPKIGAPEQALKGFLSSTGLTLDQCEQRDGYYYATILKKGGATADTLKKIIEETLLAFAWPKSMHWGSRETRPLAWVRPLHALVALLDEKIIPAQFAHLTAGNITFGHRFLSPAEIKIPHAEQYEQLLLDAQVIVDFAARRAKIAAAVSALASAQKLQLVEDAALLDEVTGLVEWPVPLLCQFDAKFLDLPPEVLISEMKNHQRYFALRVPPLTSPPLAGGKEGGLANQFITVANMVNADGGEKVKAGNARVVRARLADGEFYWTQDRLTKLEDWGKKLSDVVFHAKVGMMDAKVERIEKLAVEIAKALGFADEKSVRRAAQLCKADLTSGMVGEFPELQGIMGRYYAKAQGEPDAIAEAIYEHYKPQGAGDSLPESQLGAIISLADKLDSIVSLFAVGEKPTGSKDPLALRRAALGVLRILLQQNWVIDLAAFCPTDVVEFFHDRLKQLLRDEQVPAHVIEASIANGKSFVPVAIVAQTKALAAWIDTSEGKETLAAINRSMNILTAEEKKAKTSFAPQIAESLAAPAEHALAAALKNCKGAAPADLELLTAPINQFFTDLLVTEEGHREARLGLLAAVRDAANRIADFSKLEG
ncbi:MAG: glycine--tRNA ligase subunit beta [Rickettsiales bacterium]